MKMKVYCLIIALSFVCVVTGVASLTGAWFTSSDSKSVTITMGNPVSITVSGDLSGNNVLMPGGKIDFDDVFATADANTSTMYIRAYIEILDASGNAYTSENSAFKVGVENGDNWKQYLNTNYYYYTAETSLTESTAMNKLIALNAGESTSPLNLSAEILSSAIQGDQASENVAVPDTTVTCRIVFQAIQSANTGLTLGNPKTISEMHNEWGELPEETTEHLLNFVEITDANGVTGWEVSANELAVTATKIIIPEEYNGLPVISIAEDGFAVYQFNKTPELKQIKIPNSVKHIGKEAFRKTPLESVQLPSQLITLGKSSFRETMITEVTVPASVTTIGTQVFYKCYYLTDVTIEEGITDITAEMFRYCASLTEFTFPSTIQTVDSTAFNDASISTITIKNQTVLDNISTVTTLYSTCGTICIPKTLTITDDINSNFEIAEEFVLDGVDFLKYTKKIVDFEAILDENSQVVAYKMLMKTGMTNILENVEVPAEYNGKPVTVVDCSILNHAINVTLSSSVTEILNVENSKQENVLTNIIVDENNANYADIDGVLFNKDKTTLLCYPRGKTATEYIVPDGTRTIGASAFEDRKEYLKKIVLPDSVVAILYHAFDACSATCINIPKNVETMGDKVFRGSSVTDLLIDSQTVIDTYFIDSTWLTVFAVSQDVVYINKNLTLTTYLTDNYEIESQQEYANYNKYVVKA